MWRSRWGSFGIWLRSVGFCHLRSVHCRVARCLLAHHCLFILFVTFGYDLGISHLLWTQLFLWSPVWGIVELTPAVTVHGPLWLSSLGQTCWAFYIHNPSLSLSCWFCHFQWARMSLTLRPIWWCLLAMWFLNSERLHPQKWVQILAFLRFYFKFLGFYYIM